MLTRAQRQVVSQLRPNTSPATETPTSAIWRVTFQNNYPQVADGIAHLALLHGIRVNHHDQGHQVLMTVHATTALDAVRSASERWREIIDHLPAKESPAFHEVHAQRLDPHVLLFGLQRENGS